MAHYADTSALVKLVVVEAETTALRQWLLADEPELVSCGLTRAELVRAVRRQHPHRAVEARAVLDTLTLLEVSAAMFDLAGRLEPRTLRTLDAVHLAAALALGDDLESVVTYDERLADAARLHGLPVTAPA